MIGFTARSVLLSSLLLNLAACAVPSEAMPSDPTAEPISPAEQAVADELPTSSAPPFSAGAPISKISFAGELTQGGWIRGKVPSGTVSASLDGVDLMLGSEGEFFAAFDRDAKGSVTLSAELADGQTIERALDISPRAWNIEHVNVAKGTGRSSEAWWKKREPEWLAIKAAREQETGAQGWQQDFIWPVKGRISGRFGSQRIYRGEPGSYHSGLDIAPGAGTPFVAPADGVVVLAANGFSLEGNLLIIDHGQGLNSAFLHAQSLNVKEGDTVVQGQFLGRVGSSGRASGPHLHWGLKWRDARLDPLLFLPDAE